MNYHERIITDIEEHSVAGIKECFENGVNPNDTFRDKPLIYELTSNYARGPKFKECVRLFVDHGLRFEDKPLLAVLMDDADALDRLLNSNPGIAQARYNLDCAFTPLLDATLLHICAEFNHLNCARSLVKHGADINAAAGIDVHGFGGQTPVFHTVNQNANKCIDMLRYLLSLSADLHLTVKGIVWGKGYSWETFIPSVNPLSYAMMGLLPQFHRSEKDIYEIVSILVNACYGINYQPVNVPNKYLNS